MSEEIHELHEHAEQAHQDPRMAPVTLTMAILAVFVAAVGLLGHRAHTEEIILQNKATDQWGYYQAKNIRRHTYELFLDLMTVAALRDSQKADKVIEKYRHEAERYREEQKEIEKEARNVEQEVGLERRKADRFDLGEVCLEAALVICSITLLTRRRFFWYFGLVLTILGLGVALTGFAVQ